MTDFITSDIVTDREAQFALYDLLTCNYFKRYRDGYYKAREAGCLNRYRNYVTLLEDLNDIHDYNEQHAKSYAKRFRDAAKDWRNCEAIFSEVIVYRAYIRGIYEGFLHAIHLEEAESDIIVERLDGSKMFLEVFCLMPDFPLPEDGQPQVYEDGNGLDPSKTTSQNFEAEPTQQAAREFCGDRTERSKHCG